MKGWTLRFHGTSRRDALAEAKTFWQSVGDVGLSWEEFRARLAFEEETHDAIFVATAPPYWQVPPNGAVYGERPGQAVERPRRKAQGEAHDQQAGTRKGAGR